MAALARWLCGFDAVSGNSVFDFAYGEVADVCNLDPFLLCLEAAGDHLDELVAESESKDSEGLQRYAVWALLSNGTYLSMSALHRFFGGPVALLYSLRSSIWPKRDAPVEDLFIELGSPSGDEIPEALDNFAFVNEDDWSSIDDSL